MPSTYTARYTNNPLRPAFDPDHARMEPIRLNPSTNFPRGAILGELIGANQVETITISATGGTFTVSYGGQTTAATAYNATAATLQTNLQALSSIGANNVAVTLSGSVYTLTFQNALGYQALTNVTTGAGSLTGGGGTATVATGTAGSAGTPGTFTNYTTTATDGSQVGPRAILPVACSTDSAGNITFGGQNQIETITLSATGGTWTITYASDTTANIAWNATAAVVQAALQNIASVGVGNVTVTCNQSGTPTGTQVYTITFTNALGNEALTAVTTTASSLTGGAGTATVATTITGGGDVTTGGEFGQTYIVTDAFFAGTFEISDLALLTDAIVAAFGGRYIKGTIAGGGIVRIP